MTPNSAAAAAAIEPSPAAHYFTVEQANRALVYVRRVVRDVQRAYRQALAIQSETHGVGESTDDDRYEALMRRLGELHEELQTVGVELKDYDLGLVDFPAWHDDREVCLCWQLGESHVATWHELEDGFAGRQPIVADATPVD